MLDRGLSDLLKEWHDEAGLTNKDIIVVAARTKKDPGTLKLCTNKPELLSGKDGDLVNKYKNIIREKYPDVTKIKFIRPEMWYIR